MKPTNTFHNQFEQTHIDLEYIRRLRRQKEAKWSAKAEQELASLMLDSPVRAGYNFSVYKRPAILDDALHNGTVEDYVAAIKAVANSEKDSFVPLVARTETTSGTAKAIKERFARKRALHAARQARLRQRKMAVHMVL